MARVADNAASFTAGTTATASLTGTSTGDTVVVILLTRTVSNVGSGVHSSSTGMTEVTGSPWVTGTSAAEARVSVWVKTLASAETSWVFTWGTSVTGAWGAYASSGRDQATPVAGVGITEQAAESTTLNYGGTSTSRDGCDIVWLGGWASSVSPTGTITPDAGFTATERQEVSGGTAANNSRRVHLLDEVQTTAGAVGAETATAGNAYYGFAGAVALQPPFAGPPVVYVEAGRVFANLLSA